MCLESVRAIDDMGVTVLFGRLSCLKEYLYEVERTDLCRFRSDEVIGSNSNDLTSLRLECCFNIYCIS